MSMRMSVVDPDIEIARLNAEIRRLRAEVDIYREAALLRDKALDERNQAEARLARVVEILLGHEPGPAAVQRALAAAQTKEKIR